MSDEIDINSVDLARTLNLHQEEEQIFAEYSEPFRPHEYRQVFYGTGKVDALFPEGFFESAMILLKGITTREFRQGIEGVAAVFLCRHYLELALKYTLFHSRWLKESNVNAVPADVTPVGKGHNLQWLWGNLIADLKAKPHVVPKGLDLDFVGAFVKEFHAVDQDNWRFRYPGEQLPVERSSNEKLTIDFDALLVNLQHTYDVLGMLDTCLIETFGQNDDWEVILRSF